MDRIFGVYDNVVDSVKSIITTRACILKINDNVHNCQKNKLKTAKKTDNNDDNMVENQ